MFLPLIKMRRLLANQILLSVANLLIPYILLFFNFKDWHEDFSRLMVLLIFGRGLFYSGYTSLFIEGKIAISDNVFIKVIFGTSICTLLYFLDKSLFLNNNLIFVLFVGVLFEDFRRKQIYMSSFNSLNIATVITSVSFLLAAINQNFIFISVIVWTYFILKEKPSTNQTISLKDIYSRSFYILTAVLSYSMGGGYIITAADVLDSESFGVLRYILLILTPVSFLGQIVELAWFREGTEISKRSISFWLIFLTFICSLLGAMIVHRFFENWTYLIILVFVISLFIALNTILRLMIREKESYGILLLVMFLSSIPYFSLIWISNKTIEVIYSSMLVSQLLLTIMLFLFLRKNK